MKTKQLVIPGIILAVIIGGIFIAEQAGTKNKNAKAKEFFPGFTESHCGAFQITENNVTVKIKRQGDIWVIESPKTEKEEHLAPHLGETAETVPGAGKKFDYPADSASVAAVLEKIAIMKRDELISKNPGKQEVFEVDSIKGTLVEVWDVKNKSLGKFRIGKSGPDWTSHFVRMVGANEVYSAGGSVKYAFFGDENRWRDKTVLKFNPFMAKKITLAKKNMPAVTLEKTVDTTGARWNITAPKETDADSAAVARMVHDLSVLITSNFEDELDKPDSVTGLTTPYLTVSVELENGVKQKMTLGNLKEDDNQRWVTVDDKKALFLLYTSKFDNIDKSFDDLKKKESADN